MIPQLPNIESRLDEWVVFASSMAQIASMVHNNLSESDAQQVYNAYGFEIKASPDFIRFQYRIEAYQDQLYKFRETLFLEVTIFENGHTRFFVHTQNYDAISHTLFDFENLSQLEK